MEHAIQIDSQNRCLNIRITGRANLEQAYTLVFDCLKQSEKTSIKHMLFDCRQLLIQHLTANDIHEVASLVKSKTGAMENGKWAIIMRNKADFGLARMWQLLTENHVKFKSKIFQSYEQAVEWLQSSEGLY